MITFVLALYDTFWLVILSFYFTYIFNKLKWCFSWGILLLKENIVWIKINHCLKRGFHQHIILHEHIHMCTHEHEAWTNKNLNRKSILGILLIAVWLMSAKLGIWCQEKRKIVYKMYLGIIFHTNHENMYLELFVINVLH